MNAPFETVVYGVSDAVASITMNRPDSRNALNAQMCREMAAAFELATSSDQVRLVLVRGAGTAFCAGADLKERQAMEIADVLSRRTAAFELYRTIEVCPKPVIAVVHGAAAGSGLEIAAACDFIVATRGAEFWTPEAQWGTVGATQRLPKIVGKRLAKELMFTGRRMGADEARDVGLVNRVVPAQELDMEVAAMVDQIVRAPPLAVALAKRCIDRNSEASAEAALAEETSAIEENLRRSAWKESINEFGSANANSR